MESNRKSEWKRPELTVLVRSRPEEAVLTACKGNGIIQTADISHSYCSLEAGYDCHSDCNSIAGS